MGKKMKVEEIVEQQGKLDPKFKKTVKAYITADLQYKDAKARRDDAKEPVEEYVKENGVPNRPGTDQSILIVDGWKVQYTCRQGKTRVNEDARLTWCQENAPQAVITKPVVSEEMWNALKATGQVPEDVLATVEESGTSYYLRVWLAGEAVCPKCEEKVHADDTFCRHCGLKLPFDKKEKKEKPAG